MNCLMQTLSAGDHVVAGSNLYGGSYRQFTRVHKRFGLSFTFVDTADLTALESAFRPATRMLVLETPRSSCTRWPST
jgi:cystathionine gamma-lyase